MRPSLSGGTTAVPPRSRKSSMAEDRAPTTAPGHGVPTTFFLRSEEQMEQSLADSHAAQQRGSSYGVESFEDVLGEASGSPSRSEHDRGSDNRGGPQKKRKVEKSAPERGQEVVQDRHNVSATQSTRSSSPSQAQARQSSLTAASQPVTPMRLDSPAPDLGFLGTPKSVSVQSFRSTDEDSGMEDAASQAIASSGEEEAGDNAAGGNAEDAPQLVMPSIKMPTRRPFTARGRSIGRLKIMVAGATGAGKTSLIRSIVQACEDIVHVDPFAATPPTVLLPASPRSKVRRNKHDAKARSHISEIYASTKAYPPWWSEMEESRMLRRRKSGDDTVLERNVCFVDTPGYENDPNVFSNHPMDLVVQYIETLLHRNASITGASDSDLLGVLSGHGGVQVDVVLYLFSDPQNMKKDVAFFERLSQLTNVIPIISKADTLSSEQVYDTKLRILNNLHVLSIRPFLFSQSVDEAIIKIKSGENNPSISGPFAVSSAVGADTENMDASLLMSSEYIQPLTPSELESLIRQLFEPDNVSWLRHSAVKKFIRWRAEHPGTHDPMAMHASALGRVVGNSPGFTPHLALGITKHTPRPLSSSLSNTSGSPLSPTSPPLSPLQPGSPDPQSLTVLPSMPSTSYALARLTDHNRREHRLAQARLASWAIDLQRSLRNERARYEQLARHEQAAWLLERLDEDAADGRTAAGDARANWAVVRGTSGAELQPASQGANGGKGSPFVRTTRIRRSIDPRDPLKLCALSDRMARTGWVVVRVLGGVGVLGAIAVAVIKVSGGLGGGSGGAISGWPWPWQDHCYASAQAQQASEGHQLGLGLGWRFWDWLCGSLWG